MWRTVISLFVNLPDTVQAPGYGNIPVKPAEAKEKMSILFTEEQLQEALSMVCLACHKGFKDFRSRQAHIRVKHENVMQRKKEAVPDQT